MALIVTPGSQAADSYVTLADALSYHAARGNAAWAASSDDLREPALRRATAWLDGRYHSRWPGYPLNGRAQALDWPRGDAVDRDGYPIDVATIAPEIVAATCEAALRELASPGSLSPDVTPGTAKVLTTVGKLGWTPLRNNAGALDMAPTLLAVDAALANIIGSGRNSVSLVRA